MRTLVDTYSVTALADAAGETPGGDAESSVSLIENLVVCDKLIVDAEGIGDWGLRRFCEGFGGAFELLNESPSDRNFPLAAIRSLYTVPHPDAPDGTERILARTHHYAELAKSLDAYLCLHPSRIEYLYNNFGWKDKPTTAKLVISHLDQKITQSDAGKMAEIDLRTPPILESVLRFKARESVELPIAINEIRASKNAIAFRKWCSEIDNELRGCSGRSAIPIMQKLIGELDSVAEAWEKDLNLHVHYKRRTISLKKIWGIGSLLEAVGLSEFEINDPVILQSKQHLLFLNDLYRS